MTESERAVGVRRLVKRWLIGGYCHGLIPAAVVKWGFHLMNLRGL